MATEHKVRRIPWERVQSGLLPALEQARERASLEPLGDWLDVESLDESDYVLTGRKYLLFGVEQRDLINAHKLLLLGLVRVSEERLDLGSAGVGIADALRAGARHPEALALWEALMGWDHGLPEWLTGHEGPSLASPEEVAALREHMPSVREERRVASDPALAEGADAMAALLERCGEGEGLAITAESSSGAPTWNG